MSESTNTMGSIGMDDKDVQHSQYNHDFIIGFADGLTVPFALTAGLSSLGSSKLLVIAGLAELFSGSISMGLGSYLAATTDRQHFENEEARKYRRIESCPDTEVEQIYDVLQAYGPDRSEVSPFVKGLCLSKEKWVNFMMDFELKIQKPKRREAYISALVMGFAYFIGGLLPMIPYFAIRDTTTALGISIGVTAAILMIFGYMKARMLNCSRAQIFGSVVKTLAIGTVAAGASYGIVRGVDSSSIF